MKSKEILTISISPEIESNAITAYALDYDEDTWVLKTNKRLTEWNEHHKQLVRLHNTGDGFETILGKRKLSLDYSELMDLMVCYQMYLKLNGDGREDFKILDI